MPELPLRVKAAQDRPDDHPSGADEHRLTARDLKQGQHHQGRYEPQPAERVASQSPRLRDGIAPQVDNADMPGFHGQCLALCPEPDKVNAKNDKNKGLQGVPVVHGIAGLAEGAEEVAGNEDHSKQKHALIQPASHAAPQSWCCQFCLHGEEAERAEL